jgi:RNA-directed DNA polymerase
MGYQVDWSFDRINHSALLTKVNASPSIRNQLRAWLKAGVLDGNNLFPTEEGTMQGGNISPLLANVALHGLETMIVKKFPRSGSRGFNSPKIIRYCDDFVRHEARTEHDARASAAGRRAASLSP